MRIDLGGGEHPRKGYVNLDPMYSAGEWKRFAQDVPWPVGDGTIERINACHVLEHIPAGAPRIAVFDEAWRVLVPEGVFEIRVPLFPHPASVSDPTHLSFFVPDSFRYFTKPGGPSGAQWHVWRLAALTHSDWEIQCLMAKP